jgi:[histone H3]-lysine36 N-dimethyltransferase SETMAR
MKKENLRFYIKIRANLGKDAKSICDELKQAMPASAPSLRTVMRWFKHFSNGSERLEDMQRSGRPITATNNYYIRRIESIIEENPYITYDEIKEQTSISIGTIHNIIKSELKLKKLTSRWVPHELSDENRKLRVEICRENLKKISQGKWRLSDIITGDESWFYHRQVGKKQSNASWVKEGERPRTVVRNTQFSPKTMFCIFFKASGPVHISYVDKGKTIDNVYYLNNCVKPIINRINKDRKKSGTKNLKFHHDNARPHVHSRVISHLKANKFIIMRHPPYSPDLAPSDFWLFNYIKDRLDSHSDAESLNKQITRIANSIPIKEYRKTFEKWVERMELCIKAEGDYFEHLIK